MTTLAPMRDPAPYGCTRSQARRLADAGVRADRNALADPGGRGNHCRGMNAGHGQPRRMQAPDRARECRARIGGANEGAPCAREIHGDDEATGGGRFRLLRGLAAVDERNIRRARRFDRRDTGDLDFAIALELRSQPLCQLSDAHAL